MKWVAETHNPQYRVLTISFEAFNKPSEEERQKQDAAGSNCPDGREMFSERASKTKMKRGRGSIEQLVKSINKKTELD